MSRYQIMTDQQWVDRMKKCAREASRYWNEFPFNLLYVMNRRRSADCHNLQKALFNGRDVNDMTEGSFCSTLVATGDCTEYGLLMQCSDVQWYNFRTLKLGEPRCLYMEGHFGAWLGEEWEEPGQGIVNCVESTPRWEDGIQFSYIDRTTGTRHWCKGANKCGTWEAHGLASKWVIYQNEDTQEVVEKSKQAVSKSVLETHFGTEDLAVAFIRNKFGNGYENRLNNCLTLGYEETEVRAAQDLTNKIVRKANEQKQAAEKELTIITAAYDAVCGKYGDGANRIIALVTEFGEDLTDEIRARVDSLIRD